MAGMKEFYRSKTIAEIQVAVHGAQPDWTRISDRLEEDHPKLERKASSLGLLMGLVMEYHLDFIFLDLVARSTGIELVSFPTEVQTDNFILRSAPRVTAYDRENPEVAIHEYDFIFRIEDFVPLVVELKVQRPAAKNKPKYRVRKQMRERTPSSLFSPVEEFFGTDVKSYAVALPLDQARIRGSAIPLVSQGGYVFPLYGTYDQIREDVLQNILYRE